MFLNPFLLIFELFTKKEILFEFFLNFLCDHHFTLNHPSSLSIPSIQNKLLFQSKAAAQALLQTDRDWQPVPRSLEPKSTVASGRNEKFILETVES